MESLWQDIRLALRGLGREPGVAMLVIGSLALAIAANGTAFSLIQAVEFPRLIYPAADRIVFLESRNSSRGLDSMPTSAPDAIDIAAGATSLAVSALTADQSSVLATTDRTERISGRRVASTFFDVLRVAPALGRRWTADDGPRAILLSDALWRSHYGSDPAIVGRTARVDRQSATIVGVMPPGCDPDADFWVPLEFGDAAIATATRDDRQFTMFARLANQASLVEAERELSLISARLSTDHPSTNREWTTTAVPLTRLHGRDTRSAFFLLQGAVVIVLLIACANVTNLLLARGTRRARELAVRLSLGATRGRLIRQLLVDSVLLSGIGGVVGVWLAMWGIRAAIALGGFPDVIVPTLNVAVVGFTAAITVTVGLVTGLLPAFRGAGVAPATVLRGASLNATPRGRARAALVATQTGAAVVLLVCGALMTQAFLKRQRVDLGFDPRGAIRADVALDGERYNTADAQRDAAAALAERVTAGSPGAALGLSTFALPSGVGTERVLTRPLADGSVRTHRGGGVEAVSTQYFAALAIPARSGRLFTDRDTAGAPLAAVINDTLAAQLWPGESPIGARLRMGAADDARAPEVTVVGVVGAIRRSTMHDRVIPRVYLSFAQFPGRDLSITLRSGADTNTAVRLLADAVHHTDPELVVDNAITLDADLAAFIAPLRMITLLLGGFGLTGLCLAAMGVFGTMSYTISQRRREFAIRGALGAGRPDLRRLIAGTALGMTLAGLAPGLAGAWLAARALRSFLFDISPADPLTFAIATALIVLVALAACYRPLRAAAAADPATLMRE